MPERMEWRAQRCSRSATRASSCASTSSRRRRASRSRRGDGAALVRRRRHPYAEMWHDDTFWLPRFLAGERILPLVRRRRRRQRRGAVRGSASTSDVDAAPVVDVARRAPTRCISPP